MSNINLQPHIKRLGNNDYVMVSGRVLLAHEDNPDTLSVETSIESISEDWVIVRARVRTRKGIFTGHAVSNLKGGSAQEKKTPIEVAETSAVGRALGFAGYAIEGGIASADEIQHGTENGAQEPPQTRIEEAASKEQVNEIALLCSKVDKTTRELCAELGVRELSDLRAAKAKRVIARLQELANQPKPPEVRAV